jgi:hypothetical protein
MRRRCRRRAPAWPATPAGGVAAEVGEVAGDLVAADEVVHTGSACWPGSRLQPRRRPLMPISKITNSWAAVLAAAPNVGAAEQLPARRKVRVLAGGVDNGFYRADDDVWLSVDALDEVIAA